MADRTVPATPADAATQRLLNQDAADSSWSTYDYPRIVVGGTDPLVVGQSRIDPETGKVIENGPSTTDPTPDELAKYDLEQLREAFGKRIDPVSGKPVYFELAAEWKDGDTKLQVMNWQDQNTRKNELPVYVSPWEMRIGGCTFVVPPVNINISTSFKAGTLTGGAIRQSSSPKFNSGYSETVIELTLYFPNSDTIWGYEGINDFTINFDTENYLVIDNFLSSLRGLVAQFRYAPFLPVRSAYLNNVYGITAVGLQSMTVSTIPGYPFCLAVNLSLVKFNHSVYMPMIDHFDAAVHWGKFRQYMGRAAARLSQVASQKFLEQSDIATDDAQQPLGTVIPTLENAADEQELEKMIVQVGSADEVLKRQDLEDLAPSRSFSKTNDIEDGLSYAGTGGFKQAAPSHFELYYPYHDPARVDLPDLSDFKPSDEIPTQAGVSWWQGLLSNLGIDIASKDYVTPTDADKARINLGNYPNLSDEAQTLANWLDMTKLVVDKMNMDEFQKYVDTRAKALGLTTKAQVDQYANDTLRPVWFGTMYQMFLVNPFFAKKLALQDLKRGNILIDEWEVPMQKVGLADSGVREFIQVQSVTVSMGNNIIPLQIQMMPEPTHQHIGGMDTTCSISMTVFGEKPLLLLRRTFDTISGLARIEHGHGVLGFLGVKNVITALCGMRYCMPSSFEVDTIPNFPHMYQVRLVLTDFDVFQQKRETLSALQQAEMVQTFKTKKNPFLRVKQIWGQFNAYPDFPLAVRDDKGSIIGNLDPDFYFNAYQMIDDDIIELSPAEEAEADKQARQQKTIDSGINSLKETGVNWSFGKVDDPTGEWIQTNKNGITVRSGNKVHMIDGTFDEMTAQNTLVQPTVPGLTAATHYIKPLENGENLTDKDGNPVKNGGSNLLRQWQHVMADWQYRDKSGRMIRAFPTYMLWLISENGTYAGIKLFDNFYGVQSVIDFSINQSEDILGDTLVLRISNVYSRLSTPFKELFDERYSPTAHIINTFGAEMTRQITGMTDYLMNLDTVEIAPGARVHLRIGYSSNPNAMDTVFNGVVTEVETGEILTLTCQSDAIELGALVNTTNSKGSSGKIDGTMVGLYMSEPRDLMCQLLSMGSGVFREVFAHATAGKVFSENRFGIRHFGSMLYASLNDTDTDNQQAKKDRLQQYVSKTTPTTSSTSSVGNEISGITGLINPVVGDIVNDMWANLGLKPDYEIFKRNIYPGNGSGIAQYLGGDIGDGGLNIAMMPTGVDPTGQMHDSLSGQAVAIDQAPLDALQEAISLRNQATAGVASSTSQETSGSNNTKQSQVHSFLQMMGITSRTDDDINGFDEYAFRASTYMKTVWDMFQTCAALLPNYIVAVRPFEDRSTIFYGKPGWSYTSGLIPLTLGVGLVADKDGKIIDSTPDYEMEDAEWQKLYDQLTQEMGQDRQLEDFYSNLTNVQQVDPNVTINGIAWTDKLPTMFPSTETFKGKTISLVGSAPSDKHFGLLPTPDQLKEMAPTDLNTGSQFQPTVLTLGMHLPVGKDLESDKAAHKHVPGLPPAWSHPHFMNRWGTPLEAADYSGDGESAGPGTPAPEIPDGQTPDALTGFIEGGDPADAKRQKYDPDNPDAAIFDGDDASWDGKPGAMFPDANSPIDPTDEEWYIAQAWNVTDRDTLIGARIIVYNPRTNKAVICTPGDIAPNGKTVVSPDAMYALSAQEGIDMCFLGFVPRTYPVGPVDLANYVDPDADPSQAVAPKQDTDPTTGAVVNKPADLPPAWAAKDPRIKAALDRSLSAIQNVSLPWLPAPAAGAASSDPAVYAFQNGWKLSDPPVPVNYGNDETAQDPETGLFDELGSKASTQFGEHAKDADEIWNEFRQNFRAESICYRIFVETFPQFSVELGVGIPKELANSNLHSLAEVDKALSDLEAAEYKKFGITVPVTFPDGTIKHFPSQAEAAAAAANVKGASVGGPEGATGSGIGLDYAYLKQKGDLSQYRELLKEHPEVEQYYKLLKSNPVAGKTAQQLYDDVMDSFIKFMWQNPYNRGWLVRTADKQFKFWAGLAKSALTAVAIGGAGILAASGVGIVGVGAVAIGGTALNVGLNHLDIVKNTIETVTDGTTSDGSSANKTADGKTLKIDNEKDWNFDEAHKVWKLFITDGPDAAIAYMREHRDEGKDNTGIFSRLAEEFDTGVLKPIKDLGTEVAHVVGSVVTGLGAFLRLSLLQMNNGIGMKNNMQRRTNMLNRLLNDSLYYQAGSILATGPSLLRLADNPFTREYGEPVVEIREPFQRLHHVNSFQHILKNGIIETSDEIATVITAVSNGAHPVTVHFDKGSPAEYQKERVVDTDLLWDKVDGLPFIKNIPIIGTLSKSISAIFHPVTALRGAIKTEQGYSDELSSKRVALYHLRESLKDIYTGELLVIGDAGIRPHDLVYLSDVYERMYGFFEVEAVTHHFTPETGFVTGITPNAIVTVNDPGRWYIFSHLHQQNSFKALRDHMRQVIGVRTEGLANGATAGAGELNANDLVNIASNLYTDTTQYAGGMSSLVKDIAGGTASASIVGGGAAALGTSALASAGVASLAGGPVTLAAAGAGALFGGALAWDAWKWVRDNLLDQHGCYIQYLTKNGAPMDAGLAPNSSTAVGRQHGTSFTFNALRLPEFTIPTLDDVSKQKKITTSELLASLGYTPQKITEVGRFATKAAEDTAMRVMKLMQRGDALPGQYEWAWVKVVAVKDGDTVVVQLVADNAEDEADIKNGRLAPNMKALPGSPGPHGQEIRFLVVNSPEDHYSDKTNFKDTPDSLLSPTRGVIATQYTRARFFDDGAGASYTARTTSAWVKANGLSLKPYANEIGLRILKNEQQDRYKRTLAFLFHQGLKGQSARDRKRYIYQMATGDADWQNYTSDGNPLTYNQELLAAGMATIEVNPILRSLPGQGVELSGQ